VGIWKFIAKYYDDFTKGLDVGCGRANGVEYARSVGQDVYGCDISDGAVKCWKDRGVDDFCNVAPANNMPYVDQEFDMVVCSEVMEHIPEDQTMSTLRVIFRVGSDKYFFTIALTPEQLPIAGYIQTHITVKSPMWWFERFAEAGFTVIGAGHDRDLKGMSILAVRDEAPYIRGDKALPVNQDGNPIIVVIGDIYDPAADFFVDGKEVQI
jgi:predicted TPR repeat methyltransferase